MRIVSCTPEHIRAIELQPRQAFVTGLARTLGKAEEVVAGGPCFAGLVDDRVIACMGVLLEGEKARDLCWTMLSKEAGVHLVAITHAAIRFMNAWQRSLWAYSETAWEESARWHQLLGFQVVGMLYDAQKWLPDGHPQSDTYKIWMRAPR
jgi:hypothetical protein